VEAGRQRRVDPIEAAEGDRDHGWHVWIVFMFDGAHVTWRENLSDIRPHTYTLPGMLEADAGQGCVGFSSRQEAHQLEEGIPVCLAPDGYMFVARFSHTGGRRPLSGVHE